ncbi:MAG: metallophosphoesterase family protein [Porphyromonadaceae bacterium]|nr:metallophosphoesterase family protein [Porphyromonadaceae bacterium]
MQRSKSKRRRLLIILFVLAVGIGVLLKLRWRAWFGNPPEAPYTTAEQIDRLTITPGQDFASTRSISWRCGESLQPSEVLYTEASDTLAADALHWRSIPAQGSVVETRSGRGCYYTARLDSLKAGRQYLYRVRTGSRESSGHFQMPSGLDTLMRFIYIGDVQDPSGQMSSKLFDRFTGHIDSTIRPSFVAAAGDQIEGPTDEYWHVWYSSWGADYLARTPFVVSTGNHEYLKKGFARELDPRWVAQYNYPPNGPEGFEGRSYYIDFPLMRFIVLDSNGINDPVAILRHRSWLRDALEGSTQPWQAVMFHHAVQCVRDSRSHPVMRYVYKPILEEAGADLVLQGHDHAYSRITTKHGTDSISPLYVISSSSPKVYRNGFNPVHDRLGSGLQLYQSIEVRPQSLRYRSHLYSGELYDDVELRYSGSAQRPNRAIDRARNLPERFEFNAFGSSSKAQKKADQYRAAIRERAESRSTH